MKYWKIIKDDKNHWHYELVPVERVYCNDCKVLIVNDHCFCEWEESNEPGNNPAAGQSV